VAERGVRPDRVVMAAPSLDQDLRLSQAVEDLPIQQLVAVRDLAHAERLDDLGHLLAPPEQHIRLTKAAWR
jgi:hypothetical protein